MIKSNELRLGNFIYWNIPQKANVPHRVVGILNNRVHTRPVSLGDSAEDYDPIPLTPEILEKCGFNKFNYLLINDTPFVYDFADREITVQDYNNPPSFQYWFSCKHLHQLQNLIHALTGEELKIEL